MYLVCWRVGLKFSIRQNLTLRYNPWTEIILNVGITADPLSRYSNEAERPDQTIYIYYRIEMKELVTLEMKRQF